jgi:hypothetical protein
MQQRFKSPPCKVPLAAVLAQVAMVEAGVVMGSRTHSTKNCYTLAMTFTHTSCRKTKADNGNKHSLK